MRDYMTIGSSPVDEKCVGVGEENYEARSLEECNRYIALIRKKLGPEPFAAQLRTKLFPHDFGSYREVVCYFDDKEPASVAYAQACEGNGPQKWNDETPFDWKKEYEVEYDEVTNASRWKNPPHDEFSEECKCTDCQRMRQEMQVPLAGDETKREAMEILSQQDPDAAKNNTFYDQELSDEK